MMKNSASNSGTLGMVAGVGLWAALLFGTLQLHHYSGTLGQSICGPWGCAAAPEALAGYHAFWLVLIVPSALLTSRALPPPRRRTLAVALLAVGVGGACAIGGRAAVEWRRHARSEADLGYTLHRAGFVLATSPDVPVVPTAVAGVACLAAGRVSGRRTPRDRPEQSGEAAAGSPETP